MDKKHKAFDEDGEQMPTEQEALNAASSLIQGDFPGGSDFDKGMRILQQELKKRSLSQQMRKDGWGLQEEQQ